MEPKKGVNIGVQYRPRPSPAGHTSVDHNATEVIAGGWRIIILGDRTIVRIEDNRTDGRRAKARMKTHQPAGQAKRPSRRRSTARPA
jgi:hypothetical protein